MSLTLTATDAADLRAQVLDIFPGLAGTVSVGGPDARALTEATELLATQTREITRLEALLVNQCEAARAERAALVAELAIANAERTSPQFADALADTNAALTREIARLNASLASIGAQTEPGDREAYERVATLTAERHQALTELADARAELATLKLRCEEPAATPKPRASRAKPLGDLVPAMANTSPAPPTVPTRALPDNFTNLPEATSLEDGAAVIVCIPSDTSPTGWATPGGTVKRKFEGVDRYEVTLGRGGAPAFVTSEHMRGVPVHVDALEAAIAAKVAEQAASADILAGIPEPSVTLTGAIIAEVLAEELATEAASVPVEAPVFVDTPEPDRPLNATEMAGLRAYVTELDITPADVTKLITENFAPRTRSAEVMASELPKLRELMRLEAQVPF